MTSFRYSDVDNQENVAANNGTLQRTDSRTPIGTKIGTLSVTYRLDPSISKEKCSAEVDRGKPAVSEATKPETTARAAA